MNISTDVLFVIKKIFIRIWFIYEIPLPHAFGEIRMLLVEIICLEYFVPYMPLESGSSKKLV
jgi:hypothetical protein